MKAEKVGHLLIYHNRDCIEHSMEFAIYTYLVVLCLDTMHVEKHDPMFDLQTQPSSGRISLLVVV